MILPHAGEFTRFFDAGLEDANDAALVGLITRRLGEEQETTVAVTHLDFAGEYTKALIEQQQAAGVAGAALAKFVAEMEQFKLQYANPFYRLPMVFAEIFPVGVLVSAVSAGLLRNSRFLPAQRGVAS